MRRIDGWGSRRFPYGLPCCFRPPSSKNAFCESRRRTCLASTAETLLLTLAWRIKERGGRPVRKAGAHAGRRLRLRRRCCYCCCRSSSLRLLPARSPQYWALCLGERPTATRTCPKEHIYFLVAPCRLSQSGAGPKITEGCKWILPPLARCSKLAGRALSGPAMPKK